MRGPEATARQDGVDRRLTDLLAGADLVLCPCVPQVSFTQQHI